jgi:hypothetical protein
MMETPASHLALLRVQYGQRFRIDHDEGRYTARERASGRTISASSPSELEGKLIEQAAG